MINLQASFLSHSKSFWLICWQNQKYNILALPHNLQLANTSVTVVISDKKNNPQGMDLHQLEHKGIWYKKRAGQISHRDTGQLIKAVTFPEVIVRAQISLKPPDLVMEHTRKPKRKKISKTQPHSGYLFEPTSSVFFFFNPSQHFSECHEKR